MSLLTIVGVFLVSSPVITLSYFTYLNNRAKKNVKQYL